jgi:hypothetical protein
MEQFLKKEWFIRNGSLSLSNNGCIPCGKFKPETANQPKFPKMNSPQVSTVTPW